MLHALAHRRIAPLAALVFQEPGRLAHRNS
jgi:hypothetical protein